VQVEVFTGPLLNRSISLLFRN